MLCRFKVPRYDEYDALAMSATTTTMGASADAGEPVPAEQLRQGVELVQLGLAFVGHAGGDRLCADYGARWDPDVYSPFHSGLRFSLKAAWNSA